MDEHYEVPNRRHRRSQPLDPGNLHMVSPMKPAILASLALLITLPAFAQDAPAPTPVRLGEVYADSLGSEDLHAYAMELEADYFVLGSVDQITVDVVVTVKDPVGEEVGEFNVPARGAEFFRFTTESAAFLRWVVTDPSGPPCSCRMGNSRPC